jgi:hypothetical protein
MASSTNVVELGHAAKAPKAAAAERPPVTVQQRRFFPETVLDEVRQALAPLAIDYFDDYAIRANGTDAQARAALLLQGRGLPGDAKPGQRRFVFKTKDGRKVDVIRRKGVEGFIEVHVRKTPEEERAIIQYGIEKRARMERDAKGPREDESPERYRACMSLWVEILRRAALQGNDIVPAVDVASRRLSPEDTAAAIKLIDQLQHVVSNAKIIRCGPAARASLSLVCESGRAFGVQHDYK